MTKPTDTESYLRKSMLIVEEFRKVNPEIPAQMIVTFLAVAQDPGIIAAQIADQIGSSTAAVSRLAFRLSTEPARNGETANYGLIEYRRDPDDRRRTPLHLTRRGAHIVSRLKAIDEDRGGN